MSKVHELCNFKPYRAYSKGEFRSMLWLRFDSQSSRDHCVEVLGKAKLSLASSNIWIAADSPISMRVERKFLFGLKKLLVEWGWQSFEIRVDLDNCKLTIDGTDIVSAHAHDQQFDVRFASNLQSRLQDDALVALYVKCEQIMKTRKVGKGTSKGQ